MALPFVGFHNPGNKCYMNSALQALFRSPHEMRTYLTSGEYKKDLQKGHSSPALINALAELFTKMEDKMKDGQFLNECKPHKFLSKIRSAWPAFYGKEHKR
eukprot:395068_1